MKDMRGLKPDFGSSASELHHMVILSRAIIFIQPNVKHVKVNCYRSCYVQVLWRKNSEDNVNNSLL